jgi:hypothetical protein
MFHFDLCPPVVIGGQQATTLKEAAYILRQYAIQEGDHVAWNIVQGMRDAKTRAGAEASECQLRAWLEMQRFSKAERRSA